MKTKLTSKAIVFACTGIAVIFISAGVLLTGGVNWLNPPAGHFVSPLASNISWGPAKTLKAFFPAQANLQWLGSVPGYTDSVAGSGSLATHPGAANVQNGSMECRGCHQSTLDAGTFAAGLVNKPKGIKGKDPYKNIEIQASFDSSYLYIKTSWQTQFPRPGISHQSFQLRSGTWYNNAKYKTSAKDEVSELAAYEFFSLEDRLGIQLTPKTLGDSIKAFGKAGMSFTQGGCFIACHSSMRDMPKAPTSALVQADPWLGTAGLAQKDVRHYLLHTRGVNAYADATADGNWASNGYNATQQQADLNSGNFIDLIQYRAARSGAMYNNTNDAILEYRHSGLANTNKGDNSYFDQDPNTAQPANWDSLTYDVSTHVWKNPQGTAVSLSGYDWMYDSTITGFWAMPDNAVNPTTGEYDYNWALKFALITQGPDRNAVPLDTNKIKENERLPRAILRKGSGIRGATNAFSQWDSASRKWTVIVRRPLNKTAKCDHGDFGTYCSDHDIRLADLQSGGQGITIAFAVFDDQVEVRYHHVTFAYSLSANPGSDIVANDISLNGIAWFDDQKPSLLKQNDPNPFNKTTQIKYSLPQAKNVRLEIYDIYGRAVKTLVNEYKSAGPHTVTWDASNLSKGVYFYQIQAGDVKQVKRALVIE